MVFCCFADQAYDEDAFTTIVAEEQVVNNKKEIHDNSDNRKKVSVIVPDGMYAGQALMVRSPDGKQVTQAVVPKGCGPGQSFFVQFPTYTPEIIHLLDDEQVVQGGCVSDIDRFLTPIPSIPEVLATHIVDDDDIVVEEGRRAPETMNTEPEGDRESPEGEERAANLEPEEEGKEARELSSNSFLDMVNKALMISKDEDDTPDLAQSPSAATAPPRLSSMFKEKFSKVSPEKDQEKLPDEIAMEQKVLQVKVPPGVQAGSTIYVEIPGENRTVAATVPEGAKSFNVCYIPRPMPLLAPPEKRSIQPFPEQKPQSGFQRNNRSMMMTPPIPEESMNVPTTTAAISSDLNPTGQQKLLLVRVPRGTKAGTTIHVAVPDEPGRILAAVVPAGDVREFHVSYESRMVPIDAPPSPQQRSYLPPASPYRNHSMGGSGLDSTTSSKRGRF